MCSAFARTATHFHQANVDNNVDDLAIVVELGGVSSARCALAASAASHPDIGEIKIHAIGSKGGLVIEARPEVSIYYRDQPPLEFKNERIANENDFLLMDDLRGIDTGSEPISTRRPVATLPPRLLPPSSPVKQGNLWR